MLLRAADAGEIEIFLQMTDAQIRTQVPEASVNQFEDVHWTLPHVEAERAEDLLIQTGESHERRFAARRAALRAAVLFMSAAPAPKAEVMLASEPQEESHAVPTVTANCIKILPMQHHTLLQNNLDADPAIVTFGRLPPSLIRSW